MRRIIQFLLPCLLCLVCLGTAQARLVRVVYPDGSGDYPTIQAAVDACNDDDEIWLMPGVFSGPGNRDVSVLGKNLLIKSLYGNAADCVIDLAPAGPAEPHRAFVFAGESITDAALEAVTIRGGYAPPSGSSIPGGGALLIQYQAIVTVTDCVFENNHAGLTYDHAGGAVYADYGCQPVFRNCVFRDNSGYFGGALASNHGGRVTLEDCRFIANKGVRGGAVWGLTTEKIGCLFYANQADFGGAVWGNAYGTDYYENCTLVGNWATQSGGAIYAQTGYDGTVEIVDTIIANSTQGAGIAIVGNVSITLSCSDLFGNAGGDWIAPFAAQVDERGNFSADPCFCDPEGEDFRLCADSWCLPGHHPWGCDQLVGAYGAGCGECMCAGPVVTEMKSWGDIKALYR